MKFVTIDQKHHHSILVDLNEEYFEWVFGQIRRNYQIEVLPTNEISYRDFANIIVNEFAFFTPPEGISYLVYIEEVAAGMGALRNMDKNIGEIKRMYIRPNYRGKGLGKKLLERLLEKAKEFGFSSIYLNTGPFMKNAQHLYHSLGFAERDEYEGSEVPEKMKPFWLFMEKEI